MKTSEYTYVAGLRGSCITQMKSSALENIAMTMSYAGELPTLKPPSPLEGESERTVRVKKPGLDGEDSAGTAGSHHPIAWAQFPTALCILWPLVESFPLGLKRFYHPGY